ncbi:MAG TPA: M50 family metallopeptidase, partial [Planctomycetota bacterium]|nr:M50 family metallopeptidase [Planctomycetota bacterium]
TLDEGGACETEGGNVLLIVSAGYLGSMLFGGMLLYLSRFRDFVPLIFGLLTAVMVSAVATVLDPDFARTFAIVLAGAFVGLGFIAPPSFGTFALRVLGTVSCLYSIFDIYWDVLAERRSFALENDATVFASLSGTDPKLIGMLWLVVCIVYFLFVLRLTIRTLPEEERQLRGVQAKPA